jgi:hypothetical protein
MQRSGRQLYVPRCHHRPDIAHATQGRLSALLNWTAIGQNISQWLVSAFWDTSALGAYSVQAMTGDLHAPRLL